jgi:AcrR family transcriptional regulator
MLLETRSFDEISIAEITEASKTTVGSFYARFPDKGSLLLALQAQAHDDVVNRLQFELAPARWAAFALRQTVEGMISKLISIPDEYSPVFKAAMLSSEASRALARKVTEIIETKIALMTTLVLSKRGEIRHPNPERVARSGASIVESVLQHRRVRLFVDTVGYPLGESNLHQDLCEMYLALLGLDDTSSDSTAVVDEH